MKTAKNRDKRGEAKILYGMGLRNQKQWYWALSRYFDSSNFYYTKAGSSDFFEGAEGGFIDVSDSKKMIDKGIAMLKSSELKAHYLHFFVRNKDVMKYYDTKRAQQLRLYVTCGVIIECIKIWQCMLR